MLIDLILLVVMAFLSIGSTWVQWEESKRRCNMGGYILSIEELSDKIFDLMNKLEGDWTIEDFIEASKKANYQLEKITPSHQACTEGFGFSLDGLGSSRKREVGGGDLNNEII